MRYNQELLLTREHQLDKKTREIQRKMNDLRINSSTMDEAAHPLQIKHLKTKAKRDILRIIKKNLNDAKSLSAFNNGFAAFDNTMVVERDSLRFRESKRLTRTEQTLQQVREEANGQNDMFIHVLHRLYQRVNQLPHVESEMDSAVSFGIAADANAKRTAFLALIHAIKKKAAANNPMVFYKTIVEWETEACKANMAQTRSISHFFSPKSISVLLDLKKDILIQINRQMLCMDSFH